MKLQGKITMLINETETSIFIEDQNSRIKFLEITLNPEQLYALLSRKYGINCEINIKGLERLGKMHEHTIFEFEIPKELRGSKCEDKLHEIAQSQLTDGWVADKNFSKQDSFFTKDGIQYARCTIRRWV